MAFSVLLYNNMLRTCDNRTLHIGYTWSCGLCICIFLFYICAGAILYVKRKQKRRILANETYSWMGSQPKLLEAKKKK